MLLNNVNCNKSHSRLFQCVHPLSIGIHNYCSQDSTAGVKCVASVRPSRSTVSTPIHLQSTTTPASTVLE